jgi:molybdenum-dependent DNA-binding transcriptional regulator ModE
MLYSNYNIGIVLYQKGIDMEIREIEYFKTIAEEKSLSLAAKKLNITQPPLSRALKKIEEELNVELFKRGKTLEITQEGKTLYEYSISLLSYYDEMIKSVTNISSIHNKTIRLGIISSYYSNVFKNVMTSFIKNHKDVIFNIKVGNTYQLIDMLDKGIIDLILIRTPFNIQNINSIKIKEEPLCLVSYNKMPDKINLSYLDNLPLILYRRFEPIIKDLIISNGYKYNLMTLLDDAKDALLFLEMTNAYAIVPKDLLSIKDFNLNKAIITDKTLNTELHIAFKDLNKLNQYSKDLINMFKNEKMTSK